MNEWNELNELNEAFSYTLFATDVSKVTKWMYQKASSNTLVDAIREREKVSTIRSD